MNAKHWAGLFCALAACCTAPPAEASYRAYQSVVTDNIETLKVRTDALREGLLYGTTVNGASRVLDAIPLFILAATAQIDLNGDTAEAEVDTAAQEDTALNETHDDVPAWMTESPGPNQAVLTSDPYQSSNECVRDLDAKSIAWVKDWLQERSGFQLGDLNRLNLERLEVRERLLRAEHIEHHDSLSVGRMVVMHRFVEINEHDAAWLERVMRSWRARHASVQVAAVGCGVLGCLGVVYVALGFGQGRSKQAA